MRSSSRAPCDVIVLRAEEKLKPERILVLSGGLWHVSSATKIAAEIAGSPIPRASPY